MGLLEQHIAFKFTGGIESKADSKTVPAVRLLALENGVFHRAGSIKKRNGYAALSKSVDGSPSPISGARRLASRDDELLLFTDNRCYSRQSVVDQWSDAGPLIAPIGYDRAAVHTGSAQTTPDRATNGGVTAYAWEDSRGGVWWTVVDAESEHVHKAPAQANAAAQRPRCVAVGDAIHIYYAVPTLRQICVLVVNPSRPSAVLTERVLVGDLDTTNPVYDVCSTTRGGRAGLARATGTLTGRVTVEACFAGVAGNLITFTLAEAAVSDPAITVDTSTQVTLRFDATAGDMHMDTTWAQAYTLIDTSTYVRVLTQIDSGTMVLADAGSVTLSGGSDGTATDSNAALIAWHEHATDNIRIGYVSPGGTLGSPLNGHPSAARLTDVLETDSPIAVAFKYVDGVNGDYALLSYMDKTTSRGIAHVLSGGTTLDVIGGSVSEAYEVYNAPSSVQRIAMVEAEATVWCVFEEDAAESSQRYCVVGNATLTGDIGTERTIRSLGLASRGFQAGAAEDTFAVFVHDTTYFNTYLTLRLSDFADAGRHTPGSASAPVRSHLPSADADDSVVTIALPFKTRLESENNDKFTETSVRNIVMDFDSEDSHQTAQFGRGLYLAAACPQHYDGYKWTEQGFHVGPEYITASASSGGSLTTDSSYEYIVWYEWTDAAGEIHRGPTSIGVVATTAGASRKITLAVPTLRVTQKTNVRICVARDRAGDTSQFFRVSSLDPTTEGDDNGYIANDTTVDSVSFVDVMSDANAALEEEIYTVNGILSNDPAPLGSHVTVGKNRLFFTDAQAGNVVRFSKRIATGYGAECAPELSHDLDPLGGDITALATMDDVVYVFKASAIFAFNGDGPFENGESVGGGLVAGFSSSQLITSDVGCTDPSSIALTPQGLMFKSAKGIRLITRSRELVPIGDAVEAYNAQSIRRATVMPDRTAVLFLTDDGSSLYFDYQFGQWSTFANHEGNDACVVANTYYYLRTNDVVYQETVGSHADAGRRIRLRLETAWLHLHEHLQGFQRFWKLLLLGTWQSPHQLAVSHRRNYDEEWTEPYYLDATGMSGPPVDNVYAQGQLYNINGGGPDTILYLRSLLAGEQGNSTVVSIVGGQSGLPTTLTSDTPTLVEILVNISPDGYPDATWEDVAALLNTSAYVTVTGGTPTGTLTEDDMQSTTLAGGVDAFGSQDYYGWITGDSANPIGEDPILGSDYGDGLYGDDVFGGTGPDVYQWRYGIHEDGQAIQFRFEDYEKAGFAGASFELTEMTIVGGVKKSDMRPFSAARST